MRQFFLRIPSELDEAATHRRRRALHDLVADLRAAVAPGHGHGGPADDAAIWNDFLGPLIYLTSPENYTLALGLSMFQGLFVTRTDYIMAISTLMVLPMIILFVFAQRYIVQGFVTSGLKG